jgi:16S rRNA (guanine1207-N2)-methyltransferase
VPCQAERTLTRQSFPNPTVNTIIQGVQLKFETEPGLFSPQSIDEGTASLLANVQFHENDKVLDLGCGYGAIGIYAAKRLDPKRVFLVDNDPAAVECAIRNAQLNGVEGVHIQCSDGFRGLNEKDFTKILCNPPYHSDFSVAKHFIEKGFNRLVVGGSMWMVTKREDWYRNKLKSIFGGVRVKRQNAYFVFEATKKTDTYANARS